MLPLMLAVILTNSVIIGQIVTDDNTIPNNTNVMKDVFPNIVEEGTLPDGRLIILVNREDLDLATAIIEAEARCRENLAICASQPAEPASWRYHWGWIATAALLFFSGGLALGHFL
jgi:hypothetical protein